MPAKVVDVLTLSFKFGDVKFKCEGYRLKFDGYTLIYNDGEDYKKSSFPKVYGDSYDIDKINNE